MKFLIIRSLPLARSSSDAWREVGGLFTLRTRTTEQILRMAGRWGYQAILNLGNSNYNLPESPIPVFNDSKDVRVLLTPARHRELFEDLIPEQPEEYPCDAWVKGPGCAGQRKYHYPNFDRENHHQMYGYDSRWDIQLHKEGIEYRVITVNGRVVQSHKRVGDNGHRNYLWVGVHSCPKPVRQIIRKAAKRLEGNTVVGWDIILTRERPYLLEGNACPGVSLHTARRIVEQMEREIEEGEC